MEWHLPPPQTPWYYHTDHQTQVVLLYTLLVTELSLEGIGLILVIQAFDPSTLSVLYDKGVYPTSSIVWSTTFPINIFKFTLDYTKHYHIVHILYTFFTLLILKFIYIYVHYYVFIYCYYYPTLGVLNISFY